jgi:hypothetical protein
MSAKLIFLALVFALTAGIISAQPDPKKGDDKKLVTKVYNIKPLLGPRGKAAGLTNADAIIKMVFESIPELRELKAGADGPQIVERDGGKLEVRATEKVQEEIKELLDALERLQDLAVDVKAKVIEFDPATYEKLVKALPKSMRGKPGSPIFSSTGIDLEEKPLTATEEKALEEANKILKTGRVVQTSSRRFVNGAEATVSARRTVVTYTTEPDAIGAGARSANPLFVKEGFGLVALPVVSVDRRFIRFKLTEQSTIITGMRKLDLGVIAGEKFLFQSLETEDLGATGSAEIPDGGRLMFRLAYAPKDKVWVVVLHPTIFIQAEQDELKKQGKPVKPGSNQ